MTKPKPNPKLKPAPSSPIMEPQVLPDDAQPQPPPAGGDDDDDDPITASYSVYLNPALPLGRRLLVLQHPNRTDDAQRPPPSELRLKSRAGMVEVDVPLDHALAYDREKGLRWGRALRASMAAKSGGSHGVAGGFGIGAVQQRPGGGAGARKRTADGVDDDDDGVLDWSEAVRQDKVLRIQTLGGQYPETNDVQYMVGVFHGSESLNSNSNSNSPKGGANLAR